MTFFFWRKKPQASTANNVYGMIDNELQRLHNLFDREMKERTVENANLTWKIILEFHKMLLKVCEISDQQTQQKVAEMVLIGDKGGSTKDN